MVYIEVWAIPIRFFFQMKTLKMVPQMYYHKYDTVGK